MLPLWCLESTDNRILYEFPEGKPNPREKCTIGEERRERVLQSTQKGACCYYYAFNYLRRRIGKQSCRELRSQRRIERACSQLRKKLTEYDSSFPIHINELYSKTDTTMLQRMDRRRAQSFLDSLNPSVGPEVQSQEVCTSIIPCVEEFLKSEEFENLHQFLLSKRAQFLIELNMEFLAVFPTNVETMIQDIKWQQLCLEQKAASLSAFVRDLHADLYGLERSKWDSLKDIDKLIVELKEKGPLMIQGDFGMKAYIDPPVAMKQIGERDIYAWKPGAKRYESMDGHTVILVGAEKTQKIGLVFFIDPADPSDPKDRTQQKIYAISFKNFTSNIRDLIGFKSFEPGIGHAYHSNGNFKISPKI